MKMLYLTDFRAQLYPLIFLKTCFDGKKGCVFAICCAVMGLITEGSAQTSFLEKSISVRFAEKPLGDALQLIANQAGCRLAYNASIINEAQKVSLAVSDTKLREALRQLLGNTFQFKERDEFIIIKKLKQGEQVIEGYISDKNTGKKLDKVTVYDRKSLKSATTNRYGYYEIVTRQPIEELSVSRIDYTDTAFEIRSMAAPREIDVSLLPQPKPVEKEPEVAIVIPARPVTPRDPYRERTLMEDFDLNAFVQNYADGFRRSDAVNVSNALSRKVHWSIAPYLGNNGGLSGSIVNDYSFNATVGYSKGNRKLEIGGLGNINRGDVSGVQIASLLNIVNRELNGFQVSGVLNRAKTMKNGLQLAGITNTNDVILRGIQVAGVNNHVDVGRGRGWQLAGFVNKVSDGKINGQVATTVNSADTVNFQVGVINKANHLRGLQIGLVNVCDTVSGVVLGLINVVKKGYNVVELSNYDGRFFNFSYKTGTRHFYTIYSAGVLADSSTTTQPFWYVGLGLGTGVKLSRSASLTLDLVNHHLSDGRFSTARNELLRANLALNLQLSKKFSLAVGPTFNAYFLKKGNFDGEEYNYWRSKVAPRWEVKERNNYISWFGFYAAARFF